MHRRPWTKQRVIEAIRDRHRQGQPLEKLWKEDQGLYACAKRYCGSWREALFAAGFKPKRRNWTKENVIAAIQTRHRKQLPLRNISRHDAALGLAGSRLFGSWKKALAAAGMEQRRRRKWTGQLVVEHIQDFHQQGFPVGKIWRQDKPLVMAGIAAFGSWRAALASAGLTSARERWSPQRVIRELRDHRHRLEKVDRRMKSAAKRHFGTWQDALVATGLLRAKKPRNCRTWSREQVTDAIRFRQHGIGLERVRP